VLGLAEDMTLFPEVDEHETVQNVVYFFTKEFPKMLRMSGHGFADLQSPIISDMPKGESSSNKAEKMIVRRLQAEQVVKRTQQAVAHCDSISAKIISLLYLEPGVRYDYQVWTQIGYQERRYRYYKNRALLMFADAYLLDDLHIYLK
jgi:ArpU family phage transcriptional regulator